VILVLVFADSRVSVVVDLLLSEVILLAEFVVLDLDFSVFLGLVDAPASITHF
jgi:hypothetical protein